MPHFSHSHVPEGTTSPITEDSKALHSLKPPLVRHVYHSHLDLSFRPFFWLFTVSLSFCPSFRASFHYPFIPIMPFSLSHFYHRHRSSVAPRRFPQFWVGEVAAVRVGYACPSSVRAPTQCSRWVTAAPSRPRSVNTYRTDTRADDNCRTSTYWLRTNAFLRGVIFCQDVLNTTNGENVFFVGSHPTDIIRPSAKRTSVHRSTSLTVRLKNASLRSSQ